MNTLPDFDERALGQFIRHQLNTGVNGLEKPVTDRLFAARQLAMSHHKMVAGQLSLAGAGHMAWDWCESNLRPFLVAASLVVAVVCGNYLVSMQRISDQEDIDSAVLSDDLPLDAYLDSGFHSWLEDTSSRR